MRGWLWVGFLGIEMSKEDEVNVSFFVSSTVRTSLPIFNTERRGCDSAMVDEKFVGSDCHLYFEPPDHPQSTVESTLCPSCLRNPHT